MARIIFPYPVLSNVRYHVYVSLWSQQTMFLCNITSIIFFLYPEKRTSINICSSFSLEFYNKNIISHKYKISFEECPQKRYKTHNMTLSTRKINVHEDTAGCLSINAMQHAMFRSIRIWKEEDKCFLNCVYCRYAKLTFSPL